MNESQKEFIINEKDTDFNRREDKDIFSELLINELLALDLYSKLHNLTDKTLLYESWVGENPEEFFEKLAWLI